MPTESIVRKLSKEVLEAQDTLRYLKTDLERGKDGYTEAEQVGTARRLG